MNHLIWSSNTQLPVTCTITLQSGSTSEKTSLINADIVNYCEGKEYSLITLNNIRIIVGYIQIVGSEEVQVKAKGKTIVQLQHKEFLTSCKFKVNLSINANSSFAVDLMESEASHGNYSFLLILSNLYLERNKRRLQNFGR